MLYINKTYIFKFKGFAKHFFNLNLFIASSVFTYEFISTFFSDRDYIYQLNEKIETLKEIEELGEDNKYL